MHNDRPHHPAVAADRRIQQCDSRPTTFPGKTLGIVAIPIAIFFSVIGIILGFVAKSQSKKVGAKNTPATIAIVIGFVVLILTIVAIAVGIGGAAALISRCGDLGPGVHEVNGVTYTCS